MVSKEQLKNNAFSKFESSKILFENGCYDESIYLIGYSIELALKYKICKILKLDGGFPENKMEFQSYIENTSNDLGKEIKKLNEIKNHDLQKLLYYSGQEFRIKANLLDEWTNVSTNWNSELRYSFNFGNEELNESLIVAVDKILKLIFKRE
jgi:HEPN domain-containing protein